MGEDVLHKTLRQLLDLEKSEVIKLRAELAAIRDATDIEIDNLRNKILLSSEGRGELNIHELSHLCKIAKARGLKIAEQAAEIERLLSERETGFAAEEACRTLRSVIEGTKKHTAELIRERDEAIGLLKWLVNKFTTVKNILPQMAHYDLGEGLVDIEPAKRILELTAK